MKRVVPAVFQHGSRCYPGVLIQVRNFGRKSSSSFGSKYFPASRWSKSSNDAELSEFSSDFTIGSNIHGGGASSSSSTPDVVVTATNLDGDLNSIAEGLADAVHAAMKGRPGGGGVQDLTDPNVPLSPDSHAMPKTLYALPMLRKPTFPGFFQELQLYDGKLFQFLLNLKNQGVEHVAAFMSVDPMPTKPRLFRSPHQNHLAQRRRRHPGARRAGHASSSAMENEGGAGGENLGLWGKGVPLRQDVGRVSKLSNLHTVGTLIQLVNFRAIGTRSSPQGGQIVILPQMRLRRIAKRGAIPPSAERPLWKVPVEYFNEPDLTVEKPNAEVMTAHRTLTAGVKQMNRLSPVYKEQFDHVIRYFDMENPDKLIHLVSGLSSATRDQQQEILALEDLTERVEMAKTLIEKDLVVATTQVSIREEVGQSVTEDQRRAMLERHLAGIEQELGVTQDERSQVVAKLREQLEGKVLPEAAEKTIEYELKKYDF